MRTGQCVPVLPSAAARTSPAQPEGPRRGARAGRGEPTGRTTTRTTPPQETSWTMTTLTGSKHETLGLICNHRSVLMSALLSSFHATPSSRSEFPPITSDQERNDYKREFDRDHQEYKDLQGELDAINKQLSEVDQELDELEDGSPQYLVRSDQKCICSFSAVFSLLVF